MMIGPAPMIRMLSRSSRRGIFLNCLRSMAIGFHGGREALKQRLQVVGPGARLGVALERESRPIGALDALQGAVEQRAVRGTHVLRQRVLLHGEAVILAR